MCKSPGHERQYVLQVEEIALLLALVSFFLPRNTRYTYSPLRGVEAFNDGLPIKNGVIHVCLNRIAVFA